MVGRHGRNGRVQKKSLFFSHIYVTENHMVEKIVGSVENCGASLLNDGALFLSLSLAMG